VAADILPRVKVGPRSSQPATAVCRRLPGPWDFGLGQLGRARPGRPRRLARWAYFSQLVTGEALRDTETIQAEGGAAWLSAAAPQGRCGESFEVRVRLLDVPTSVELPDTGLSGRAVVPCTTMRRALPSRNAQKEEA